jgi:hypothetical protein
MLPALQVLHEGMQRRKDHIEGEREGRFVRVLGMIEPAAELVAQLPSVAATQWSTRKEQMAAEASTLVKRLQEQQDLNRRAIKAKSSGEISGEDFQNFKESTDAEIAAIKLEWKLWIKSVLEWKH